MRPSSAMMYDLQSAKCQASVRKTNVGSAVAPQEERAAADCVQLRSIGVVNTYMWTLWTRYRKVQDHHSGWP